MPPPADVHYGRAEAVLAQRQVVMQQAYERYPERFVNGPPRLPELPAALWINMGTEPSHATQHEVAHCVATGTEDESDTGILP